MSSRYDSEQEREYTQERENVEVPLPTYEEVVGASNIGFKTNVLLPPTNQSTDLESELPTTVQNNNGLQYERGQKRNPKVVALITLGLILIPICATIFVVQTRICTSPSVHKGITNKIAELQDSVDSCDEEKRILARTLSDYKEQNERTESQLLELKQEIRQLKNERRELLSKLSNGMKLSKHESNGHETQSEVITTTNVPTSTVKPTERQAQFQYFDQFMEDMRINNPEMYKLLNPAIKFNIEPES